MKIALEVVHQLVRIASNMTPSFINKHIDIIRRVHLLENLQIDLELLNYLASTLIPRLMENGSIIGSKPLLIDAICMKMFPVLSHVSSSLEINYHGLTNGNVFRRGIVV